MASEREREKSLSVTFVSWNTKGRKEREREVGCPYKVFHLIQQRRLLSPSEVVLQQQQFPSRR